MPSMCQVLCHRIKRTRYIHHCLEDKINTISVLMRNERCACVYGCVCVCVLPYFSLYNVLLWAIMTCDAQVKSGEENVLVEG